MPRQPLKKKYFTVTDTEATGGANLEVTLTSPTLGQLPSALILLQGKRRFISLKHGETVEEQKE